MRLTKAELEFASIYTEGALENKEEFIIKNIPSAGKAAGFNAGQMTLE